MWPAGLGQCGRDPQGLVGVTVLLWAWSLVWTVEGDRLGHGQWGFEVPSVAELLQPFFFSAL